MAQAPAQPSQTAPMKPASPGAFSVRPMSKTDHIRWLNILIYGQHGAGKSTLSGSAVDVEEMQDILVVTAEGGEIVYQDNPRVEQSDLLDIIKIDRIQQFNKVYEFIKAHVHFRDTNNEEKLLELQNTVFGEDGHDGRIRRYRTVIIDSLSEIEAQNLAKILDLDSIGLDAGDEMEVAGFPQFRKNMHLMQRAVRNFRDLPIHFIATCAETYEQDERKAYHYSPKLTGQLKGIIQGFFDVVGWLVINNATVDQATGVAARRLFVQPQKAPRADAKCRLASYKQAFFEDPTMESIMTAVGIIKK